MYFMCSGFNLCILYVVLMIPLTLNQDFINLFIITSSIHNFFSFDGFLGEDLIIIALSLGSQVMLLSNS